MDHDRSPNTAFASFRLAPSKRDALHLRKALLAPTVSGADFLTTAHKFVPERVFTLGAGGGANSLVGAAGILGDFLDRGKSAPREEQ